MSFRHHSLKGPHGNVSAAPTGDFIFSAVAGLLSTLAYTFSHACSVNKVPAVFDSANIALVLERVANI